MFLSNPEIDSGFYTLKFDSLLLKEAVVEADSIIPPLRDQDPLSSESDADELTDGGDAAYARGMIGVQMSLMIFKTLSLMNRLIDFVSLCFVKSFGHC